MTAIPGLPAAVPAFTRLVDAPTDHRRRFGLGEGRQVHRFPAATFLDRRVAREEHAVARESLEASDRTATRRLAGLASAAVLLFATVVGLVVTERGTTGTGLLAVWGAGAAVLAVVAGLVAVLRQHAHERDVLTERVRMYEARLAQLRTAR